MSVEVSRAGSRAGNADLRAGILQKNMPLHSFELLTGSDAAAQKLYSAIGFECDGEMHMSKQVK